MTFTAIDYGTYLFLVFDDEYSHDPVEEFDFDGYLSDVIDWAITVANEGYEVDIWANDTVVAWIDASGVNVAGQYAA